MVAALRPHVGCGCRAALHIAPLLGLSLPPIPPPTSAWRARALLGRHRRRAAKCWLSRVGCHRRLLTAFLVPEFSLANVGEYKSLCILTSFRLAQKYRWPLKKSLTACFSPPALRAAPAHSPHGGHTDPTPPPADGLTRITLPRKKWVLPSSVPRHRPPRCQLPRRTGGHARFTAMTLRRWRPTKDHMGTARDRGHLLGRAYGRLLSGRSWHAVAAAATTPHTTATSNPAATQAPQSSQFLASHTRSSARGGAAGTPPRFAAPKGYARSTSQHSNAP